MSRRILLIEDEPGIRAALQALLVDDGYTVRTANSGYAGLEQLREFRPDTVVCDFFLPDIDGLQVLRRIRAAGAGVVFIMMTAGCGGHDTEDALRDEADFFFDKPVDLFHFRRALEHGLPAGHHAAAAAIH